MDGLVFQDADSKKYSLGTVFLDYANKIITDVPFVSIIDPQLIKLRDETQETVGFYMLTNMVRMCVKEHVSNQEISRKGQVLAIGFRYNLAQAEGKVIGAISISGPVFRWHKESMEQHISLLLKTAESISNSLY
ncbi:hypothetical protein MOF30_15040 [Peribacillus frigoritolerans]|nr:hypothetical protein [Peribacillus frigoritolerans]